MFFPSFEGTTAAFPSFDYPYSYLNATRRRTVGYQIDGFVSDHSWSSGIEHENQAGTLGDTRASRGNFGAFAQDHFAISDRVALTAGLRVERNDSFGTALSPRFSLARRLKRRSSELGNHSSQFNVAVGIKEPNLIESFSANPYFRGNPDLEPERTRSAEVGIEQGLLANKIRVEVNGFYSYFLNQIDLITDPQTWEGRYFNIGRSQAWGGASPNSAVGLRLGGYTLLRTRIPTQRPIAGSAPRRGCPGGRLFPGASTGWYAGRWRASARPISLATSDNDFYGLGPSSRYSA
jgi:outer membrane receptor protein involved in Fe transport